MRRRGWILLLGLAVPIMDRLDAQDGAGRLQAVLTQPGVQLSRISLRIHRGTAIRLGVVGGGGGGPRISGRYVGLVGDTLLLDASTANAGPVVFDSLWTRQRDIGLNALRGAAAGALIGGAWGLMRSVRASCKSASPWSGFFPLPDCPDRARNIGRGALAGAAIGAVARVALGELFPKWKRHFP